MAEYSSPSTVTTQKQIYPPSNALERGFESVVFASRWIQAPLYGGL
ncbi:MAG: TIGR00645 family protein, partial [Nitrospira sp.]|nr:TIGR00645 family protein [Nitrospira sp.]